MRCSVVAGAALAAGLALAGCSRTADGTLVPAYRMAVDRYAGIPFLTLRRTPPQEPAEDGAVALYPPPPAPPLPAAQQEEATHAATPRRERPPPRRVKARGAEPEAAQTPSTAMQCTERPSATRAVSMVCE